MYLYQSLWRGVHFDIAPATLSSLCTCWFTLVVAWWEFWYGSHNLLVTLCASDCTTEWEKYKQIDAAILISGKEGHVVIPSKWVEIDKHEGNPGVFLQDGSVFAVQSADLRLLPTHGFKRRPLE